MIEQFRFLQGGFAACGRQGSSALRGGFLSGRPERNQRGARARLRMSAPRSYSPPLDPILRRLPLEVGRTFPARKIRSAWVRFLPGHWALGLWKIGVGAVPLLRLPFPNQRPEAVFRRRGAQCAPAGRSGTGPYAETDAFPNTPQGRVSSPARRRQRSSCRGDPRGRPRADLGPAPTQRQTRFPILRRGRCPHPPAAGSDPPVGAAISCPKRPDGDIGPYKRANTFSGTPQEQPHAAARPRRSVM